MTATTPDINKSSTHEAYDETSRSTVAEPTREWSRIHTLRQLTSALMGGTRSIRELAINTLDTVGAVLPQEEGETDAQFNKRLARTVLINIFSEAVENIVSRVFAKELLLSETSPADVRSWYEKIDRNGRHGDIFFERVALDATANGKSGVWVDYPSVANPGSVTLAQERNLGLRPYLVHFTGDQILETEWDYSAEPRLMRVRLKEQREESTGEWSSEPVEQIRVVYRGSETGGDVTEIPLRDGDMSRDEYKQAIGLLTRWAWFEIYEQDDENEWDVVKVGTLPNQTEIPFELIGDDTPPLDDLAYVQIQQFQKKADLDNLIHVVNMPALLAAGFDSSEIQDSHADEDGAVVVWGPFRVFNTDNDNARLEIIEHSGRAISAATTDLTELQLLMRVMALDPMTRKASGDEKATVRLLDERRSMVRIQSWAAEWMTSFTRCLNLMARWWKLPENAELEIREDVFTGLAGIEGMDVLIKMRAIGALSNETLLEAAHRSGTLWDSFSVEEEMARIASQAPPEPFGPDTAPEPRDTPPVDPDDEEGAK